MKGLYRDEALEFQSYSGAHFGEATGVIPPSWSRITLLLGVFFVIFLFFLFTLEFSRKETVRGRLRSVDGEAKVYALEGGAITRLYLEENQMVSLGEPIAEIVSERHLIEGGDLSSKTVGYLEAEIKSLISQKAATLENAELKKAQGQRDLNDATRNIVELHAQLALVRERLGIAVRRRDDLASLRARGLVTEPVFNERSETVVSLKQSELAFLADISNLKSAQLRAEQSMREADVFVSDELAKLDQRIAEINTQLTQTKAQIGHTVVAPTSGQITAMRLKVGERASPETPIAVILPVDAKLNAEIFLPSRAVGFIETGQTVKLLYDAFPYQRFGAAEGTIVAISSIAQPPQEVGVQTNSTEALYRVDVSLKKQTMRASGRNFDLQAGMELTADIVLERRRIIDWLINPLLSVR